MNIWRIPRASRRWKRGLATVETAIVMPVMVVLVLGTIEFGSIFFVRNMMVHAASDAARMLSLPGGNIDDARLLAQSRLEGLGAEFMVTATEQPSSFNGDTEVTVRISVPGSAISLGLYSFSDVVVSVTLRKEA